MKDYSGLIKMMESLAGDKSKVANRGDALFNKLYDYWAKEFYAKKYDALLVTLRKKEEWFYNGADFSRVKILDVFDYSKRNKLYKEANKQAKDYLTYSKEFLPDGKGSTKSTMYNEPALLELLNLITELVIAFQQEYTDRGGKGTPDTPRFIQGLIGMTCWLMLDVATSISISVDGVPRERFNTQAFVMKYMHLLSIKKGHEIFKKEGKTLQDKWGLSIQSLFTETNFYAPIVPFNYAGHKDGILGFIVRRMIKSIDYSKYYDVFGGSGRALLQIPLEESKEYYINDYYPSNYILWACLMDDDLYKEFIKKLNKVQKIFLDKHNKFMQYMRENKIDKKILQQKLDTVQDAKILEYHDWLHAQYNSYYAEYGKYTDDKGNIIISLNAIAKADYADAAVAFVVVHNFLMNGRPADTLSGGINLFKTVESGMLKWNFDRDFKGMKNAYQQSNITIQNDKDINIIKGVPNEDDVILQIDTPYISTKGYKAGEYSLDNDLKPFMNNLFADGNKRKFIFHCQSVFRGSATLTEKKIFLEFLEYMRDNGKYNYVTFSVSAKGVSNKNLGNAEYRQKLIDKFYNMVVSGKDEEYNEDDYSVDSSEIIYTNFFVGKINTAYNYQDIHNPYRLSKAKQRTGDYKVITMNAFEFLDLMIDVLNKKIKY